MNYRIFIEKNEPFNLLEKKLNKELKQLFSFKSLKFFLIYDLFNISEEDLEIATKKVISNPVTDIVHNNLPHANCLIALEFLPGQFDQRANSTEQCLEILGMKNIQVRTGELYAFEGLEKSQIESVKKYLINPIEKREKNLSELELIPSKSPKAVETIVGFFKMSSDQLKQLLQNLGLSLNLADLSYIQKYFNELKRDPTELEIRLLDTYWSDHCRHTTFETEITDIIWDTHCKNIKKTYKKYLNLRDKLSITKPIRLMDLATIGGKFLIQSNKVKNIDTSEEINACSIVVPIDVDGKEEEWLLQFKNETHNHPTEIEPYGGASTCVGGAIRDPLAGRAYVYQGIRISGTASPTESFEETMQGKLPQRKIIQESASGFSDYGNQIGVATSLVKEFYHPGYKAKHMEVGFVVGAVPKDWVRREKPQEGDSIVLIGGRTGRDGIGGAVGSSKTNESEKLEDLSAQVQKGNAIVESKIQRLFRKPEVLVCIKKCNDFGAGGLSVAIGEIADSLDINLDAIRLKYEGLNGLEIALSESQERMAVVLDKENLDFFIKEAEKENLEAYQVATVANHGKMIMKWRGETIAELDRSFLDTHGIRQSQSVLVKEPQLEKELKVDFSISELEKELSSLKNSSQKGLQEMFDSNIGQSTVLNPYGGYTQETPEDVSVHLLPVKKGETNVCSVCSYGFDPYLSENNTYLGAYFSVLESINKLVASGANLKEIRLSFQEYFEKLEKKEEKWGRPFAALLGALQAQLDFDCPAIGGKDSMSGSYGVISVPPTLISFAIAPNKKNCVVPSTLVNDDANLYFYKPLMKKSGLIDKKNYKAFAKFYHQLATENKILAAKSLDNLSLPAASFVMSLGNHVGVEISTSSKFLVNKIAGGVVFQTHSDIKLTDELKKNIKKIGATKIQSKDFTINAAKLDTKDLMIKWKQPLEGIFPSHSINDNICIPADIKAPKSFFVAKSQSKKPTVLIPSFPGTNSEFDSAKAFANAGAKIKHHTFVNLSSWHIQQSIETLKSEIDNSQILFFPGGFAAADEPDGSGKFIATILRNESISYAIEKFLQNGGLILGVCNGFQALVQSGLLPYGKVLEEAKEPILFRNNIQRHQASLSRVKVLHDQSPWLKGLKDEEFWIPISHGEGCFVAKDEILDYLDKNNQIATVYVDCNGDLARDLPENPNGSYRAIEGILSPCGKIFGRMGHPERLAKGLFKNIPNIRQIPIFENAVHYFK